MCRPYRGHKESEEMRAVYVAEDGTKFDEHATPWYRFVKQQ